MDVSYEIANEGGFPLTESFPRSGTERTQKSSWAGMRVRHVNRKIFYPVVFRGKLSHVQLFLSFLY